jgi:hypothetical protein
MFFFNEKGSSELNVKRYNSDVDTRSKKVCPYIEEL